MNIKKDIINTLKGFGIGAANVVPGVSGGTIALLTGIYQRLIDAINSLSEKETWKKLLSGDFKGFFKQIDGRFLTSLAVGILISIFSLAKLMEYLIAYHPIQTWAFFFGLIIASSVYMFFEIKNWKASDCIWAVFGAILGVVVCTLSPTNTPDDLWFIFICGAIAICTMILPGISGSFVLVILDKYEYIMRAVSELNIPVLAVFAFGCVVGIVAFAKFLHWLLGKCERQTMLVLLGFVIGSLVKVWPWNNMEAIAKAQFMLQGMNEEVATNAVMALTETGAPLKQAVDMHVEGAIIWAIAGLALVWGLETISNKNSSDNA